KRRPPRPSPLRRSTPCTRNSHPRRRLSGSALFSERRWVPWEKRREASVRPGRRACEPPPETTHHESRWLRVVCEQELGVGGGDGLRRILLPGDGPHRRDPAALAGDLRTRVGVDGA